jgi:mannose/fructose/N-acetylgalactosamine-specific phosphotransferase system component IIC
MAGVMTTVIAWSTGVDAKTAIGLGLPFSLLMQYVILFFYSAFSLFMSKADNCAEEANTAAFAVSTGQQCLSSPALTPLSLFFVPTWHRVQCRRW